MKYLLPASLETERLNLRIPELNDWGDLHQFYSDEICCQYTNGRALTAEQSRQKLDALIRHWDEKLYGSYVMEKKTTGKVIGIAGMDFPDDWPEPEIQWGLSHAYWGKGYAKEGAWMAKVIAAQYVPYISLISLIHPQNINSIKLADSLGAEFEKEFLFRNEIWHIYRH